MKRLLLCILLLLLSLHVGLSQTVSDVLHNSERIKENEKLFLKYDAKYGLQYYAAKSIMDPQKSNDFKPIPDSAFFLIPKSGINIYIRPLNPLKYAIESEFKYTPDPINEALLESVDAFSDFFSHIAFADTPPVTIESTEKLEADFPEDFEYIENSLNVLARNLKTDYQKEITETFDLLYSLSFTYDSVTLDSLNLIRDSLPLKEIEDHYEIIEDHIKKVENRIAEYSKSDDSDYVFAFIFKQVLDQLKSTKTEQHKRYTNLVKAFEAVEEVAFSASVSENDSALRWVVKKDFIASKKGQLSVYTVTIKERTYSKDTLTKEKESTVYNKKIKLRPFQRFIPEVGVGSAFTFFEYNTYGTVSDSTGQQFVGSPTSDALRNIKISTLINFNHYIADSQIHPFYQIGVSVNSSTPTFFTGAGLRTSFIGSKYLTASFGAAWTWTQELDKLKVGDPVSGTNDIEKDLKYEFSWPPKPYVGIQFNF